MRKLFKILVIIVVVVIAGAGYYTYTEYNSLKAQQLIKSSQNIKNNATGYFDQASNFESEGNYTNAISMYQKSDDGVKNALSNDNNALTYANGVYREYLDKDIPLLQNTSLLIEYRIYRIQYDTNTLNPGQEKAPPNLINPYIDQFTGDVSSLKAAEDRIVRNNPDAFKFLGSA